MAAWLTQIIYSFRTRKKYVSFLSRKTIKSTVRTRGKGRLSAFPSCVTVRETESFYIYAVFRFRKKTEENQFSVFFMCYQENTYFQKATTWKNTSFLNHWLCRYNFFIRFVPSFRDGAYTAKRYSPGLSIPSTSQAKRPASRVLMPEVPTGGYGSPTY